MLSIVIHVIMYIMSETGEDFMPMSSTMLVQCKVRPHNPVGNNFLNGEENIETEGRDRKNIFLRFLKESGTMLFWYFSLIDICFRFGNF